MVRCVVPINSARSYCVSPRALRSSIKRSPKSDFEKFRMVRESVHAPELVSYLNDEEGVDYTFQADETLDSIRYFPGRRFDWLRCNVDSRMRK